MQDLEENYRKIEGDIIKVILLDCVTNSLDRHPDNWALVSDCKTKSYSLGLYDNTVSFINIINSRPGVMLEDNWGLSFMRVKTKQNTVTANSKEVVNYIHDKYPNYFKQFLEDLDFNLDKFYEAIHQSKYENAIKKELDKKLIYLKSLNRDLEREI